MTFFLTVVGGSDDGRTFEIDQPQALVGRSGSADVKLNDETVSWEHCTVKEDSGRFMVENLSSLGTSVRGQKIARTTRVAPGEEIELSARCRIRAELTAVDMGDEKSSSTGVFLGVIAVILIVIGLGTFISTRPSAPPAWRPTPQAWRIAYDTIHSQLDDWQEAGHVTPAFVGMFEEAWITDVSGDAESAHKRWEIFIFGLNTTPAPPVDRTLLGETFRTAAPDYNESIGALQAIMGGVTGVSALDADTPLGRVRALVAFAEYREWINEQRVEES